jgi:hypothetical protein
MEDNRTDITEGFSPFQPLRRLGRECAGVPDAAGVYVVALDVAGMPDFLDQSVGGHFKSKDPTVPLEVLQRNWVGGTPVVYVGRARSSLRQRLRQLVRYGSGEPVAHHGGRYIWQLADHGSLQIAWRVEIDPVGIEIALIDRFADAYGALPYANLMRGARTDTS